MRRERDEEQSRPKPCDCPRCQPSINPFQTPKNSVSITFIPPQTTQEQNAKNQNAKNQASITSSNTNQGAATSKYSGNVSTQNTSSAPKASTSGSQQPQRNNNNNNNNNNKNNDKNTVQDYGKLNDFIKKLKAVLERCKVSADLRKKILSFFNKFEKHEENFLRILEDFSKQDIDIEDVLSIVIKLFQLEYFAEDIAYHNFISLMEIVAKYIKDEAFLERTKEKLKGNKTPFDELLAECMKKVVQRSNIVNEIKDLFEKIRKEIIKDNSSKPLEPDFSGIFTKVYHYFKHKLVKGKDWTVSQYFDQLRMLLPDLRSLTPEYAQLTDPAHPRREIVLEVYSTDFEGRFRIAVRAYGPRVYVCTFFWIKRPNKKAKDGDKYVDGKKRP